jgi:hypothetical protein
MHLANASAPGGPSAVGAERELAVPAPVVVAPLAVAEVLPEEPPPHPVTTTALTSDTATSHARRERDSRGSMLSCT